MVYLNYPNITSYAKLMETTFSHRPNEVVLLEALSGGSKAKAIIAREIKSRSDPVISHQLVDWTLERSNIHKRWFKNEIMEKTVLVVNGVDEILNVSDRIAVIHDKEDQGS